MRGGKRGRGRSLIPPSVAAAQAASRFTSTAQTAPVSTMRVPFPPPSPVPIPIIDQNGQIRDVLEACSHIQTLIKATPFYLEDRKGKDMGDGLERYSDKYSSKPRRVKLSSIPTPHSLFPEELQQVLGVGNVSTQGVQQQQQNLKGFSYSSVLAKLQEAESKDGDASEQEAEAEVEPDEEVYEEDELEDETDYNVSYFDNGEEYGDNYDGDDGGGGEPSY